MSAQKSAENKPMLVEPQVNLENRLKTMNDLYETNSFHPSVKEAESSQEEG